MSKPARIISLLEHLLPPAERLGIETQDGLLRLYAGIGLAASGANDLLSDCEGVEAARSHYARLRRQALAEDADALNDLGWLWLNGRWLPGDPGKAYRLFKLAVALGSAQALFNLGEQYYYGKGVAVGLALANDYYELAWERGVIPAARALGGLLEERARERCADPARAAEWYRRAASEGDGDAALLLGNLLLDEALGCLDEMQGTWWLQVAAAQGCMVAAERLAHFFAGGFRFPDPQRYLYRLWRDHALRMGSSLAREMKTLDDAEGSVGQWGG